MNVIKRFFTDKHGSLAVFQVPNAPLLGWLVFLGLSLIWQTGSWHTIFSAVSRISLVAWAILEIGWGASYFRRTLGVVVLYAVMLR